MGWLNPVTNPPDYDYVVELPFYLDPRTVDDSLYGSFRYRLERQITAAQTQAGVVSRYVFSFKTAEGAAKFKKVYAYAP